LNHPREHDEEREAFGRVLIEAMALSIPVVATRCGGPAEIVEDNVTGYLVDSDEPQELAKAVSILLKDEQKRKEMGRKGRSRAEEIFNPENTVSRFNEIFDSLLKEEGLR